MSSTAPTGGDEVSEQQPKPDLTPQPNPILAEPATIQNCRADYDDATDVRVVMAQQDARRS